MKKTKTNMADFTGKDIYIGIDVHLKAWHVCILTRQFEHKSFSQAPDPDRLVRYLHRNFPQAHYCCAYEAGFSGFWLQHALQRQGIDTLVVHPPDIPTSDKQRRFKRNKVDARKLARQLRAGELKGLFVPTSEQVADRALVRHRQRLIKKQTRVKNQIKSHLYLFGVPLPEVFARRYWSRPFLSWLEGVAATEPTTEPATEPAAAQVCLPVAAALTLQGYLQELIHLRQLLLEHTRALRRLAQQPRYREPLAHLMSLPGIGLINALILLTEIIDIDRFQGLDQLASFVGLVPGLGGSGEDEYEGSLTHRRSAALRRIVIESAWVAVRTDPVLMSCFVKLTRRMPKNQAIIRIARKQLSRIRFVLKHRCRVREELLAAAVA